jgi:hypothetical protein
MFVYYPIEPYADIVIIAGQCTAQTRRMGKHNQKVDRPKALRFSPYYNGQITPTDPFVHSPFPRVASLS